MKISRHVGPESMTLALSGSITGPDLKTLHYELSDIRFFKKFIIDVTRADLIDVSFPDFLAGLRKTMPGEFRKIELLN